MFLSQFQQQQNNIYIGLDLNKTTPICRNILFSTNRVHYKIVVKNESDSKIFADYKSRDSHRNVSGLSGVCVKSGLS